jgi:hypothetical protein
MIEPLDPDRELSVVAEAKQDDATVLASLANDHFAKVAVARDDNTIFLYC